MAVLKRGDSANAVRTPSFTSYVKRRKGRRKSTSSSGETTQTGSRLDVTVTEDEK